MEGMSWPYYTEACDVDDTNFFELGKRLESMLDISNQTLDKNLQFGVRLRYRFAKYLAQLNDESWPI
jgi:hypothetical protein